MSETVKLGKVSMTLGGEYKSSQSYDKLTCVYHEGSSWASKKAVPAGVVPSEANSAYWQKVSDRGAQGVQGPQGQSYVDKELVPIVNDLTTGGSSNVLAAEQGKVLDTKLTELSEEVTSILFEKGNISYGNEAANDAVYRSLYIPCKKGDIINGKIYRVKVFDANYQYLAEEGTELGGALVDYVVENANCAYVRIIILARDKSDCLITINGVNALYLIDKEAFSNSVTMSEELNAINHSISSLQNTIDDIADDVLSTKIACLPCIYKVTEDVLQRPIVFGIRDLAITPQEGYLYMVVLRNMPNGSQFSLYRSLKSAPRSLQYCGNFVSTSSVQRSGIAKYETEFGTGEKATAIVDWDSIKGMETGDNALYPDKYVLKEEVFKGGLLANNLIPQLDSVNDTLENLQTRIEGIEGAIGGEASQPKEIYWAVCGDSITNANHATIYDIAEGDQYMPIDGYPNLNTYKRKNYAYYIAQRNRLKWANYGWGGTTLSSVTSKAYGYKNAFVDDRMTSMADVEWDYISLFFGGNDSYYGPTAHKDKWLKEKYGQDIGYPINAEQIGANGFANAEQKAACDAVVGVVNGVDYQSNADYFIAKFIGSISDTSKDTWYGALNTAVSYLLTNHPKAKIILVASYTPESPKYADAVVAVAKKYGVRYFDFRDVPHWPVSANGNWQVLNNPSRADGKWPSESGLMYSSTIFGRNQALYIYDSAHPTNKGYEEMSHLLEQTIIA